MKKYIYLIMMLALFTSCEESELTTFAEQDAIYFQLQEVDYNTHYSYWDDWLAYKGDSLIYSFGKVPADNPSYMENDTVWLQVNLQGRIAAQDRQFQVRVNSGMTDAEEGVHYEALKNTYTFPADTIRTSFPVVIFNNESLGSDPYTLYIELVSNDDFKLGLEGRTVARMQILDDYVKPIIWSQYLYRWFGTYSKKKHEIIIMANDGKLVPHNKTDYSEAGGYWGMYYMRNAARNYLKDKEIYDENGELVVI